MEKGLRKTSQILLWCNFIGIFLFGGGSAMVSYLESSHQGSAAAWQFLFAVLGLCLFGYGLFENHQMKGVTAQRSLYLTVTWLSVIAGVLGVIFTFETTNVLGIITAIISAIAFVCAIPVVRK